MSNNDGTQDRAEGLGNEVKGRVEQGVGGVTGDRGHWPNCATISKCSMSRRHS